MNPTNPNDESVQNTPPTDVSSAPNQTPDQTQQAQPAPQPPTPVQTPQADTVSNAANAPSTDPNAGHPVVQTASLLHSIASALAGGPRTTTVIDPQTGQATRTEVPLTNKQIGMSIALAALSGGLVGLGAKGPGNEGQAAAAGFQTTLQQRQAANAQQEQQAQADADRQSQAVARQAQVHETNSRTLLNTSEVEQRGADAIDKLVSINRQSGVLDPDSSSVDGAQPITQDELIAGMQSGKYSSTDQLGPIAGRVEVTDSDGSKRWEATHLILKDPSTPTPVSQAQWNAYSAAGIPGFRAGAIGPQGVQLKLSLVQNANEQLASRYLANERLSDLRNTLDGTPDADKVPASIDYSKPGVANAMQRFQKYVSHNAANLEDPYAALQQMGADKRNADGTMAPNPDAKFVPTVMDAMGGPSVLLAAHNQLAANKQNAEKYSIIDSGDKAEAVLAAPKKFSADQISAATNFTRIAQSQSIGKAVAEARAHAKATGADTEAMYKFGTNPITGEKLTLQNAPNGFLVDPDGNVIPQAQQSLYKPTAQQKQTADTARQVLAISSDLQAQIAQNPALIGPLSGNSAKAFAPFGIGTEAAQKMLDNVSLLQSAITKMHTGRFSSEILKKSGSLISPGMNVDQFAGAMDSIKDVAGRYANEDQLQTVANYNQQSQQTQQQAKPKAQTATPSGSQLQIPAGAQIGRDAKGNVVGYKLPNGSYVPLGAQ
jgi:hypothetical protein